MTRTLQRLKAMAEREVDRKDGGRKSPEVKIKEKVKKEQLKTIGTIMERLLAYLEPNEAISIM